MLTTIKVYGSLAKFLGQRVFRAAVDTPLEAVSFLRANFEGLAAHMADYDYKVLTGTLELQAGSNPEQLDYPIGMGEAISIVPVVGGAGGRGTGAILAGVALVAASLLIPAGTQIFGKAITGKVLTSIGLAGGGLILSGVAQMLTPVPELSDSDLDPASNPASFSGIQNVDRQGVAVPVVYGETLVGSVVISSGINTQDD
jgi:predicted phage tail protein|tara:strand:- start:228 stop:827 length:600 start_codon:yes stop_codon:yes gene_type:complete